MNLFEPNFMSRVRRLSQGKRSFLLDVMEQTRQDCRKIEENPLYQRYPFARHPWENRAILERQERELNLALQMGSIAMWLVMDAPRKRSPEQIKTRLREIDRLVMHHGYYDMYNAITAKIEGTIFDEIPAPSDEAVPQDKHIEYESRLRGYIRLSGAEREHFIAEMKRPLKTKYKGVRSVQSARQRGD